MITPSSTMSGERAGLDYGKLVAVAALLMLVLVPTLLCSFFGWKLWLFIVGSYGVSLFLWALVLVRGAIETKIAARTPGQDYYGFICFIPRSRQRCS